MLRNKARVMPKKVILEMEIGRMDCNINIFKVIIVLY